MSELRQHSIAKTEMVANTRLSSRLADLLVSTIQGPNPVRSRPLGKLLLRARKQIEPVRVLCRRGTPFCKGTEKPEHVSSGVLVKTACVFSVLRAVQTRTDSSRRFLARQASSDASARFSSCARFRDKYSEKTWKHKDPNSCTHQSLSTPGFAVRYSILLLTAAHLPDPEIFAASSTNLESSGSIDVFKSKASPFVQTNIIVGSAGQPDSARRPVRTKLLGKFRA